MASRHSERARPAVGSGMVVRDMVRGPAVATCRLPIGSGECAIYVCMRSGEGAFAEMGNGKRVRQAGGTFEMGSDHAEPLRTAHHAQKTRRGLFFQSRHFVGRTGLGMGDMSFAAVGGSPWLGSFQG